VGHRSHTTPDKLLRTMQSRHPNNELKATTATSKRNSSEGGRTANCSGREEFRSQRLIHHIAWVAWRNKADFVNLKSYSSEHWLALQAPRTSISGICAPVTNLRFDTVITNCLYTLTGMSKTLGGASLTHNTRKVVANNAKQTPQ